MVVQAGSIRVLVAEGATAVVTWGLTFEEGLLLVTDATGRAETVDIERVPFVTEMAGGGFHAIIVDNRTESFGCGHLVRRRRRFSSA